MIFLFAILLNVFLKIKNAYKKVREKERIDLLIQVEMKEINFTDQNILHRICNNLRKMNLHFTLLITEEIDLSVIIVVALSLLKGAATITSILEIDYCGYRYNFINFMIFAIGLYNGQRYRQQIQKDEILKESIGYDFSGGKISEVYDDIAVKSSMKAGLLGGLVGLGRGVVLIPVWQQELTLPELLPLLLSLHLYLCLQQLYLESINYHNFQFLASISVCGSYLVAGLLQKIVKKYKRESIIIQVLLIVIVFGLVVQPLQQITDINYDPLSSILFGCLC